MFALLGSRLGGYLIVGFILLLIIGGVAMHMKITANTLIELRQQVTLLSVQTEALKSANAAMQADVANIVAAQTAANDAIAEARDKATTATQTVRNRTFSAKNSLLLQSQVNAEMVALFQRLETSTRAP